jgi:hypothetical protein
VTRKCNLGTDKVKGPYHCIMPNSATRIKNIVIPYNYFRT